MANAAFPKSVDSWVNRIDGVDIVFAADPNSLAAEIIAIESTLGAMPQVEPTPPNGMPVTYETVSARISDTLAGTQKPYFSFYTDRFPVPDGRHTNWGYYCNFKRNFDRWNFWNGVDVTCQISGIYVMDVAQTWDPYTSGFMSTNLIINNQWVRGSTWKWDFAALGIADLLNVNPYGANPFTGFTWMGPLNVGDRIRVASMNFTPRDPYYCNGTTLQAQWIRALP